MHVILFRAQRYMASDKGETAMNKMKLFLNFKAPFGLMGISGKHTVRYLANCLSFWLKLRYFTTTVRFPDNATVAQLHTGLCIPGQGPHDTCTYLHEILQAHVKIDFKTVHTLMCNQNFCLKLSNFD